MPITSPVTITGASANDFLPLPKDVYPFELIDIELVNEKGYQTEEMEDKLKFEFACLDEANYGRRLWKRCTLKLTGGKKPSALFTMLTEVLGRQFTKDELSDPSKFLSSDFLNSLIGVQLRISVGQKPKESDPTKINNTIDSYLPKKESYPAFDKEKSKALAEQAKAQPVQEVAQPIQPEM